MSRALIRAALESALNNLSPSLATAWEGAPFTPAQGVPFQAVFLMAAEPENIEANATYTERGYLQVNLNYPLGTGPAAAEARGELIRTTFKRGSTFTASGVTVHVPNTPSIGPGRADADFYFLPVRVPFRATVRSN